MISVKQVYVACLVTAMGVASALQAQSRGAVPVPRAGEAVHVGNAAVPASRITMPSASASRAAAMRNAMRQGQTGGSPASLAPRFSETTARPEAVSETALTGTKSRVTVELSIRRFSVQLINATKPGSSDAQFVTSFAKEAQGWKSCLPCQIGFAKVMKGALSIASEKRGEMTAREAMLASLDTVPGRAERVKQQCPAFF